MIQELIREFCTAEGGLAKLLWAECCRLPVQDYSKIFNLPQLLGNKLGVRLDQAFTPRLFFMVLMKVVCAVLKKCHHGIGSHDYCLCSLAHFIAKIITCGSDSSKRVFFVGHLLIVLCVADAVGHLISFLDDATSHDLLWQRISCSLIGYFSNAAVDVFVEAVLINTKW